MQRAGRVHWNNIFGTHWKHDIHLINCTRGVLAIVKIQIKLSSVIVGRWCQSMRMITRLHFDCTTTMVMLNVCFPYIMWCPISDVIHINIMYYCTFDTWSRDCPGNQMQPVSPAPPVHYNLSLRKVLSRCRRIRRWEI